MSYPECGIFCADAIREVIKVEGPKTIAAMIVEPITGSNCRIIPPAGYMKKIRKICDEYEILLICDEIMTGFGRTGKWFASSHWDVVPEIMTLSKGINSGYLPLGAVMTNSKITGIFDDKILYAGLTQCAAAAAAIELVKDRETKEPLVPRTANSYENKPQILKELLGRLKEEGLKSRVYEGNPFNEQLIQCLSKEVWKWILYSRELIEVN